MYDSLDTLLLMDLKPEFERALSFIAKQDFHQTQVRLFGLRGHGLCANSINSGI